MGRKKKNPAVIAPLLTAEGEERAKHPIPAPLRRGTDRVMAAQRPAVLRRLRAIVAARPDAGPAEVAALLERRYLAAVTVSGAGVGAAAVLPAVGTAAALALSGADTLAFLESTAYYAQSLGELHGLAIEEPDRARALVIALLLGDDGSTLVHQYAGELTGESADHPEFWGEVIAARMPTALILPLLDRLGRASARRLAATGTASLLARALPYGIGAVVGGVGNNVLGRRIVDASHTVFGPFPTALPEHLRTRSEPAAPAATV